MKLITTSYILFLTICIVVGQENFECPPFAADHKECICYASSKYLVCDKITENWLKSFKLTKVYAFNTLVITNSPNLPFWSEHFSGKADGTLELGITFKSLIFSLEVDPIFTKDALEELISLASEKIEIKLSPKTSLDKQLEIDFTKFKDSLTSISLSNVKLKNFPDAIAPTVIKKVENLFLDKVTFEKEKPITIDKPNALTRIEINNSPSLKGSFKYVPGDCKAEQQIEIILKNNKKQNDFDTSEMFKNDKCKYYVDLTGSTLKNNFLTENAPKFIAGKVKPANLFIIFRDVALTCDYCVQQWYKSREPYVHSIKCSDKKLFVDELTPTTYPVNPACKPSTF